MKWANLQENPIWFFHLKDKIIRVIETKKVINPEIIAGTDDGYLLIKGDAPHSSYNYSELEWLDESPPQMKSIEERALELWPVHLMTLSQFDDYGATPIDINKPYRSKAILLATEFAGQAVPYQCCPKCNGQGTVSKPPYIPGDVHEWSASTQADFVCDVCKGAKVIPQYTASQSGRDEVERLKSAESALRELVELKELKDTTGKDASYEERQPKAWEG